MEEKILAKLDEMSRKIDEMDQKFDVLRQEFKSENEKLECKFRIENGKLKDELKTGIMHELKIELTQILRKELLDHMYIFEEEYGKKLTIAYEDLISRMNKENTQNAQIVNLEKRYELNTAYIYNHENRISNLEKAE